MTDLNQPQQEAVENTQGPLLVLAGAGTGKTKVLTSRIIHIVNSYLASPLQILAVTFTNKAAAEMRKRIGDVIGDQVHNLWIGTFHSIAARILRRHPEVVGLKEDFTIIDADDQVRLLKQIIKDLGIDPKEYPAKGYLNKISRLKDQSITCHNLDSKSVDNSRLPKLKQVYETYQYRLKAMNACDFGDLLLYNLEIFSKSTDILAYYQDKFRYVLVDEYQDTNNGQYRWLLTLSAVHQNICCVGDDDQSIYSWRGADVANILRFEKDFIDAKIIRLEQNYRSTSNILNAAHSVIANNTQRHGKKLWTDANGGQKVKVISFADDRMEAQHICSLIKQHSLETNLKQIAVLVRAGYQTRSFEESFMQNSLPYRVIGGLKFYDRMEIRDSIAYLRVVCNTADDLALNRIINVPKRGVGNSTINNLYARARNDDTSLYESIKASLEAGEIKGKAREALKALSDNIEKWHGMTQEVPLHELAEVVMRDSGYLKMWRDEKTLESEGRVENIEEFIRSLEEFSSLIEFLEYVSLVEARDDKSNEDAVNIMTVHAAKGLEFDLVFVPGLEDGIFPSGRSIEEIGGVEEERRLLYVAITRAKKNLYLTYAQSRFIFGDYQTSLPSRFVQELPKDEIEFEEKFSGAGFGFNTGFSKSNNFAISKSSKTKSSSSYSSSDADSSSPVNKRIFHQKFGYGKVIEVNGNKFEIDFEKTGKKTVIKDFVTFAN